MKQTKIEKIDQDGETKKCSWCRLTFLVTDFSKGSRQCKPCRKDYRAKYYAKMKELEVEKAVKWKRDNRDRANEYNRIWQKHRYNSDPEFAKRQSIRKSNIRYQERYGEFAEAAKVTNELRKELCEKHPTEEQKRGKRRAASGEYREYYARRRAADGKSYQKRSLGNDSSASQRDDGTRSGEDNRSGGELDNEDRTP